MKRRTFRLLAVASCFSLLTALSAPHARGGSEPDAAKRGQASRVRTSTAAVQPFGGGPALSGAGSALVRTAEGVYMSLHSFGLAPEGAVTAWWVFFNSPKKCATSPCTAADLMNPEAEPSLVYATGRVVGADGAADFGAFRAVGDTSGAVLGPGLLDPFKAEIHLVVRSHGPAMLADAPLLAEQLTTFNGGCPPNTCANLQASIHQP